MKRALWCIMTSVVWLQCVCAATLHDTTVSNPVVTMQDICSDITDIATASLVVAQAPNPGSHVYLTKRDIERRFRSHGINFSGPETIKVVRKGYPLDWNRLESELAIMLKSKTQDSVDVLLKSGKRALLLDAEKYTLAFQPGEIIGGYMTVQTVVTTQYSQRMIVVSVYVAVYKEVVVPLQRINRHAQLSENMFSIKKIDCAGKEYVTDISTISLYRAKRSLENGKPISFDAIEKIPDILKGATLTVLMTTRTLQIEVSAIAMADAYKGDRVSVKLSTGKTMTASILQDGSAVIKEGL